MPGPLWFFLRVTVKGMTLSWTNIQLKRRKNLNWFYTDNPVILWYSVIPAPRQNPLGVTLLSLPQQHRSIYETLSANDVSVFSCSCGVSWVSWQNCASPSSSPPQQSIFQPFMSISSSSLVKDEFLTGVEHTTGVSDTALHSPNGDFYQKIQMTVRVTDKEMKEKQRGVADSRANPSFTPHCCLPCRHV